MKEYYNTNREGGEVFAASWEHARNQKLEVLAFFRRHPGRLFAPHEVQTRVLPTAPLTSVRRAMTNLTDEGLLEKTRLMQQGTYGKQVHRWRLAEQPPTLVAAPAEPAPILQQPERVGQGELW